MADTDYFLKGINDVSTERLRQITEEGHGADSDDKYDGGMLAAAGACYAMHAAWHLSSGSTGDDGLVGTTPVWWPFPGETWNPQDRRRNLVKAGALIIAEIDRFDRAEAKKIANSSSTGNTEETKS